VADLLQAKQLRIAADLARPSRPAIVMLRDSIQSRSDPAEYERLIFVSARRISTCGSSSSA
jgi:hypothetical protein